MLIEIDCRERELYQKCLAYLQQNPRIENVTLSSSSLPIGDIIIYDDSRGDKLVEKIIIERKSVNDLAASIRDSRYREQSFRLSECSLHNHNIFYLIEGSFANLGRRYNKNTLLSAMTSISYHKGFSLYRTFSVAESAEWIVRLADKLHRTDDPPYYGVNDTSVIGGGGGGEGGEGGEGGGGGEGKFDNYSSVIKRIKKNNITRDNIGEIMLMQIPGVSAAAAKAVMATHKNISALLHVLTITPDALDDIHVGSECQGNPTKKRKLNKTCKANIYNYLFPDAESVITIDTK